MNHVLSLRGDKKRLTRVVGLFVLFVFPHDALLGERQFVQRLAVREQQRSHLRIRLADQLSPSPKQP